MRCRDCEGEGGNAAAPAGLHHSDQTPCYHMRHAVRHHARCDLKQDLSQVHKTQLMP